MEVLGWLKNLGLLKGRRGAGHLPVGVNLQSILATGLLVVQILGGIFPLAVCEKEVIMILYKPKERTEPYKTNEQIKELYLKYRDILESPIQKKRGFIWKIKKLFGAINQN